MRAKPPPPRPRKRSSNQPLTTIAPWSTLSAGLFYTQKHRDRGN
nr:MAG TPA: ATP synthase E chain [Caudoviricetes sp.]